MSEPSSLLKGAFDPEVFRALGHGFVDRLADHLAAAAARCLPVLPAGDPLALLERWPAEFPATSATDPLALITRVIAESNHLHDPRYVGHQVTSPLPLAALCELVSALLNNGMAVFEMGPAATAMERAVVRWMAGALGMGAGADGLLTSGGSVGNLTALLAMRQACSGFDAWREGAAGGPPLCVLLSEQTHYCSGRALRIMGLGDGGVGRVPVDERFRMRAEALPAALAAAERSGRRVVAVVASAGSTATGAFDPLDAIADFCAAHGLWLHVDGAHGASLALSAAHRERLRGIDRADSVVWDAHKMLLMPALSTAVLFRDGRRSYGAFAQEASFLFAGQRPEDEWYNVAGRTLECTKRMMSLALYTTLSVYGPGLLGEYVAQTIELARAFADRLAAAADFQLAVVPECNIVCFRHVPTGVPAAALDELQARIRQRLLVDGSFYLVQTRLGEALYLRTTIINPRTTLDDLLALMDAVRAAAA
jgi:L-2,4-diaminobutyrate decarboxylase